MTGHEAAQAYLDDPRHMDSKYQTRWIMDEHFDAALARLAGAGEGEGRTLELGEPETRDDWQCPECHCRSYARIDEQQDDRSYLPGNYVRCVNCKRVTLFIEPPRKDRTVADVVEGRARELQNARDILADRFVNLPDDAKAIRNGEHIMLPSSSWAVNAILAALRSQSAERESVLEEAAKVAEAYPRSCNWGGKGSIANSATEGAALQIAAAIRALRQQPPVLDLAAGV